ncbi:hypothetical protein BC941DRAFT_421870 [Chlamydoabsidia padenii]|nr:hypothetical protein BC941DRAFT_421870 [Chlamydoabsidia padenii]
MYSFTQPHSQTMHSLGLNSFMYPGPMQEEEDRILLTPTIDSSIQHKPLPPTSCIYPFDDGSVSDEHLYIHNPLDLLFPSISPHDGSSSSPPIYDPPLSTYDSAIIYDQPPAMYDPETPSPLFSSTPDIFPSTPKEENGFTHDSVVSDPTEASNRRKSCKPAYSNPDSNTVCTHCETTNTPLWRRNKAGLPLCNACGLFFKLHGKDRPLSLKTDVIKKRNRGTPTKRRKRGGRMKRKRLV